MAPSALGRSLTHAPSPAFVNEVALPGPGYTEHNGDFDSHLDVVPGVWGFRSWLYSRRPVTATRKTREREWKLLRSRWRFLHALYPFLGPPSYLMERLFFPLLLVMCIGVGNYSFHRFSAVGLGSTSVILEVFQLTSFCMSLMLAYRINRVYDRWWAARSGFFNISSGCVALMCQVATVVDDPYLLGEFERWLQLWHLSILQCVTEKKKTDRRAKALMNADDLAAWEGTRKTRQLVGTKLTLLARSANLAFHDAMGVETAIQQITTDVGTCARIFYTAQPYAFTLHCTGFVFIWCLLLPMGLFPQGSWDALVALAVSATLLLGTDEVANQLENPFPHMPLEEMANTTLRDVPRVLEEVLLLRRIGAEVKAAAAGEPSNDGCPPDRESPASQEDREVPPHSPLLNGGQVYIEVKDEEGGPGSPQAAVNHTYTNGTFDTMDSFATNPSRSMVAMNKPARGPLQ